MNKYADKTLQEILEYDDEKYTWYIQNMNKNTVGYRLFTKAFGPNLDEVINTSNLTYQESQRFYSYINQRKISPIIRPKAYYEDKTILEVLPVSKKELMNFIDTKAQYYEALKKAYGDDLNSKYDSTKVTSIEKTRVRHFLDNCLKKITPKGNIKIQKTMDMRIQEFTNKSLFQKIMNLIPVEYRMIFELHTGMYDGTLYSYESIAKMFNTTKEDIVTRVEKCVLMYNEVIITYQKLYKADYQETKEDIQILKNI